MTTKHNEAGHSALPKRKHKTRKYSLMWLQEEVGIQYSILKEIPQLYTCDNCYISFCALLIILYPMLKTKGTHIHNAHGLQNAYDEKTMCGFQKKFCTKNKFTCRVLFGVLCGSRHQIGTFRLCFPPLLCTIDYWALRCTVEYWALLCTEDLFKGNSTQGSVSFVPPGIRTEDRTQIKGFAGVRHQTRPHRTPEALPGSKQQWSGRCQCCGRVVNTHRRW